MPEDCCGNILVCPTTKETHSIKMTATTTSTLTTWKRRRKSRGPPSCWRRRPATERLQGPLVVLSEYGASAGRHLLLLILLSSLSFLLSLHLSNPGALCSNLVQAADAPVAASSSERHISLPLSTKNHATTATTTANSTLVSKTTATTAINSTTSPTTITQATTVNQQTQDSRRRQKVKLSNAQARGGGGRLQQARAGQTRPDQQQQQQQKQANKSGPGGSNNLWRPTKSFRLQQEQDPSQLDQQQTAAGPSRPPSDGSFQESPATNEGTNGAGGGLQVSITPRVSLVRVPVESNTILKCLISAQLDNFTRPFKVRWSRFMYDENVYEQIESSPGFDLDDNKPQEQLAPDAAAGGRTNGGAAGGSRLRSKRDDEQQEMSQSSSAAADQAATSSLSSSSSAGWLGGELDNQPAPVLLDRQQQLRDFLSRSRQETNVISNILIEATLSISPVKASDNATYYCTATDGAGLNGEQNQARVDLVALSQPVLRLDRVWPARDSKSALIYWTIVSDGNTPIKRTILMVRNDSQALIDAARRLHNNPLSSTRYGQQQQSWGASSSSSSGDIGTERQSQQQQQQQQQHSSIVLDNERNQWHRIEISGDGTDQLLDNGGAYPLAPLQQPEAARESALPDDNVVRVDMDVTSIGGGSIGSNSNPLSPYSNPVATNGGDDRHQAGGPMGRWRPRLKRKQRAFNLTSLLPGVTYQLRLAAINDMGQSNWTQLQATMPNEIPAQIQDIVVLSTTNDSITIGWRRPPYDNAKTIRYELQLFDLNRTLTLDANTNTNSSGAMRTNFMFHFVNLNPGTDYHFHIRACSLAGCSAYSSPKLLASTLDGEPDEPLDVELVCQWAGGSGAPPEAPATGSGGTQQASGQQQQHSVPANSLLSVSWLPPVNVRGKLLNYSVIIESSARYLNKSGQWASDEWRTTIDTGDNHTLSLEASNLLTPNTNYTARVCANNRSRKCGRPSQLTPKSQCSTPAELPAELPGNIQLALKQVQLTDIDMDRQQVETLVLELPFISLRNGTIDCIQIVLVRLPPSFDNSHRALTDLLPDDPAELKLQEYLELDNNNRSQQEKQASNEDDDEENGDGSDSLSGDGLRRTTAAANTGRPAGGSPLAYLAEELSPVNQSGSLDEISQGMKQILLGDGTQMTCHSVWARLQTSSGGGGAHNEQPVPTHQTATEQSHESRSEKMRKKKKTMKLMGRPNTPTRPVRPIDGPLLAQTYYSGFLRLVQLRQTSGPTASNTAIVSSTTTTSGSGGGIREARTRRQLIEGTNVELVTKFSNYFSPIKTGDRVPEVSIQSLLESEQRPVGDEDGGSGWWSTNNEIDDDQALAFRANSSFCAFKLVVWVQEKLGTSNRSCLVVTGFAETARRNLVRLFKLSTSYLNERLKLANETGQNGQGKSSMATMQPLEIGLMLIVSTLLVMFVIYLFLLPARLNRKRKLQLKRKLQQHENAIVQQQQQQLGDSGCGGTGGGIISSPSHQLEVDQTGGFIQATAPGGNMLSVAAHQDGQLGQASQGQPLLVHSASRQQLEPQCQQHSSPQSQHNHQSSSSFVANNNTLGYHQQHVASVHQQSPQQQQQQPHHHHHHHHPATSAGGTLRRPNQECPVHSSPMSQLNDTHPLSTAMANSSTTSSQHHSQHHLIRQQEQDGQCNGLDEHQEAHHHTTAIHKDRRQSVHVCQPVTSSMQQQQQQVIYGHHNAPGGGGHHHHHHAQAHQHQHHHQQHHHQSAYQLNGGASGLEFDEDQQQHGHRHVGGVMDQRNCRTMTRHRQLMADDDFGLDRSSNAPVPAEFGYKTLHHHHHPHQHNQQAAYSIGPHNHHHPHHHHQHNQQQQAIASMDYIAGSAATMRPTTATTTAQWNQTLARQQSTVLALAKKINKSIPLALFQPVMEIRLKNNWLREEYEQLPRSAQQQQQQQIATGANMNSSGHHSSDDGRYIKLRPQLIVSRDDSVSALIIGNHQYDASLVKLQVPVQGGATAGIGGGGANGLGGGGCAIVEKQFICAKSPVDPNTVWDFWRLIYEKEVNTLVMLTPNEDVHTGELRCAQYWPTCDNEVTTILSPRNDSVAQSKWPLAKFKICQETLSGPEADTSQATGVDAPEFVIRRLTLLVMATKASENEHLNAAPSGATSTTAATPTATIDEQQTNMAAADKQAINKAPATNGKASSSDHQMAHDEPAGGEPLEKSLSSPATDQLPPPPPPEALPSDTDPDHVDENNNNNNDQDDEVIVERNLLHFQFLHWNASSLSNQMKLIKFIELVNEQHAQLMQQQASPGANWQQISPQNPILVHCANGIGRSGLFTAMSFVIDDLSYKLASLNASVLSRASVGGGGGQQQQQQQQVAAKLNLFQLVSRLRNHRDMLLSPYRFYELLYQLTAKCIPAHISNQDQQQQQQQQQQLKSRFVNN